MMENREYLNSLFDLYKELLTPTEQETFTDYYVEDLSLQEIADNRKITKSSVGKTLKNATEKLEEYERIIKNYQTKKELSMLLEEQDINLLKDKIKKIINH